MQFRPRFAAIGLGSGSDPSWIRNPFDHRFAVKHADPARIQVGSDCPRSTGCAKTPTDAAKKHMGSDWIQNLFDMDRVRFDSMLDPAGRITKPRKFVRIRLGSRLDPIALDQPIVQKRQHPLHHTWVREGSRTCLVLHVAFWIRSKDETMASTPRPVCSKES